MEPIKAIFLVILLLCLASFVWLLLWNFRSKKKIAGEKKRQPVPFDVQEAANQYIGYPPEVDEGVCASMRREAYAAGMLAERVRLASFPTINCWAARDENGDAYIYKLRPERSEGEWSGNCLLFVSDLSIFSSPIRWEDEPREVEIIIKEVEK